MLAGSHQDEIFYTIKISKHYEIRAFLRKVRGGGDGWFNSTSLPITATSTHSNLFTLGASIFLVILTLDVISSESLQKRQIAPHLSGVFELSQCKKGLEYGCLKRS